jgi:hypothetical protein
LLSCRQNCGFRVLAHDGPRCFSVSNVS